VYLKFSSAAEAEKYLQLFRRPKGLLHPVSWTKQSC